MILLQRNSFVMEGAEELCGPPVVALTCLRGFTTLVDEHSPLSIVQKKFKMELETLLTF